MNDAGFFDGDPKAGPLALRAGDADDLQVISALVQDAILPLTELRFDPKGRRLALLINRFRWEDLRDAETERRPYERVQSLLVISDVMRLQSAGIDRSDSELILSLLALEWQPSEDGAGRLVLEFAGDGQIAADVEALSADLRDVSKPYVAPSGHRPSHPE